MLDSTLCEIYACVPGTRRSIINATGLSMSTVIHGCRHLESRGCIRIASYKPITYERGLMPFEFKSTRARASRNVALDTALRLINDGRGASIAELQLATALDARTLKKHLRRLEVMGEVSVISTGNVTDGNVVTLYYLL